MTPRPLQALLFSGVFALLAVGVWAVFLHAGPFLWFDAAALHGYVQARSGSNEELFGHLASLADPGPFAAFGLGVVLIALIRRRPLSAVAVVVVLIGANVTTQLLKRALAQWRDTDFTGAHVLAAAWPSGHTTGSTTLSLCLLLVVAPRWRAVAATVGAFYTLVVVNSILVLGWHFPSDVLGGFCVSAVWAFAALALLWWAEPGWRHPASRARRALVILGPVLVGAALGLVAAVQAAQHGERALDFARENTALLPGGVIVSFGAVLTVVSMAAVLEFGRGGRDRGPGAGSAGG